jgi:ATP-dependent Clp protease ATP-binding subunit ClpC
VNLYDDQARLVFHYAREESQLLGHNQVGPEHLLLGLLRTKGGACDVLEGLGAQLEPLRLLVQTMYPHAPQPPNEAPIITPLARQVMETASAEARRLKSAVIRTPINSRITATNERGSVG